MLGVSLSIDQQSPANWWRLNHAGAMRAADYKNKRYMSQDMVVGVEAFANEGRNTPAWVKDANGFLRDVAALELAIGAGTGLSSKEASTNEICNPRAEGTSVGIVGSGGTFPTNWSRTTNGMSTEILGVGQEAGEPYLDIRIFGTASGSATALQFEEAAGATFASVGEAWGVAFNARYLSAPPNAPDSVQIDGQEYTGGGSFLTNQPDTITLTTTKTLFAYRKILANASVDRVRPVFVFRTTASQSYDFAVRVYAPKVSRLASLAGYFDPLPILSPIGLPGASARAASIVTPVAEGVLPFPGFNITEGTFVFEATYPPADGTESTWGSSRGLFSLQATGQDDHFSIASASAGRILVRSRINGGAFESVEDAAGLNPGDLFKVAIAYTASEFEFSVNGRPVKTGAVGMAPALAAPSITLIGNLSHSAGLVPAEGAHWSAPIATDIYYETAKSSTELRDLTA